MTVYALDPGPEHSALVCVLPNGRYVSGEMCENSSLLRSLLNVGGVFPAHLVIEQVESFGMPVGKEVFETVFWSGRFAQAWESHGALATWSRLPRRAVKMALCGSVRATDATVRQALLDRYGPGRDRAVGIKKQPGPLYGVRAHLWQALALGLTFIDQAEKHHANQMCDHRGGCGTAASG